MAFSAARILSATGRATAFGTKGAGTSSVLRRLRRRVLSLGRIPVASHASRSEEWKPGRIPVLRARRMAGVEIGRGPAVAGCAKAGAILFSVSQMMQRCISQELGCDEGN